MQITSRSLMLLFFAVSLAGSQLWSSQALAQSTYFTSRGCVNCHAAPVVASCNGCHYHGNRSLKATTNKTSYTPGETVSVTLTSSSTRTGWIRAILYNQSNTQVAVSSGNASGQGGSTTFPATLTAPAPTAPGTYTWKMAYFGNSANTGSTHGEAAVSTNSFTVASAADTTAPVVSAFTLPATATSLTVTVSSFTATDNVGVTGYLITSSATAPTAAAVGWTASAPASITVSAAGSYTFYAWARDAAGNVSLTKSASVTVTLPDTTVPVVSFTLPATATSLTVPVTTFTATDNVGVTGYLINKSATAPTSGWLASAPASVTAVTGSNTFYAWARDAAGNVSLAKSASVTVTLPPAADTTVPVVSFTLPATATSLTVPVTTFTATDNVGVTGYLINKSATAPTSGWLASAPTSVTANAAGSTIFYAWAKDAAGNVSLAKSASVNITLPGTINAQTEILWRNTSTGENTIWYMDGVTWNGTFAKLPTTPAPWNIVGLGDFNADGKRDIVWRNPDTGEGAIWHMDGAKWTGGFAKLPTTPAPWNIAGVGDFNSDGKPDLLWRNPTTGENTIWYMDGATWTGGFAKLPTTPAPWNIAGVGDFNNDGKPDIVWRNSDTGQNVVWYMNGAKWDGLSGSFPSFAAPWEIVGLGDFNNDAERDILWRNPTTGEDMVWFMNGVTQFGIASLPSTPTPWNIVGK